MAQKTLSVKLSLNDKQFQSGLRKATKSMQRFGKSMQRTGKQLSTSLTLPVLAFGAASVKAFDDQIKAETKLRTALGEDEKAFQRLKKVAQDLQKTTLFGDEATIEAAAFLGQLGLNEEAITRLLPLIQDFATAQNMQLGDAAKLVAKSVGSSTNALSRYGITIEGTVGQTDRLDSAVNALSTAFGGTAAAIAQQGLGPFEQLKNELGDVSEEFGRLILENIEPLKSALSSLAERLRSLSTEQKETIVQIAGIAAAVGPLLIILGKVITAVGSLGKALMFIASNPMVLFFTAISSLVGLLGFAILDLESFIKAALKLGDVGRFVAKGIIRMAAAFGGMNQGQADAAIAMIDVMSEEQKKLATNTDVTTESIKDQKKEIEKLSASMAKPTPGSMTMPSTRKDLGGIEPPGPMTTIKAKTVGPLAIGKQRIKLVEENIESRRDQLGFDVEPVKAYTESLTQLNSKMEETGDTFQRAFHSMSASANASFSEMAASAANAARQVIKTQVAEATAAYAAKIFASVPFPFNLALSAAAGSVVGSLFNKIIPPFADGGMVSGATLAMVGEGPGTSAINPEVIAPLDKLKGMIGEGGSPVEVFRTISGSDILLSSDRAGGNRNRTSGY